MHNFKTPNLVISALCSAVLLSACGGSGGSSTSSTTQTTPPAQTNTNSGTTDTPDATWKAGTFPESSSFLNYCANPRNGGDRFNNNQPYADKAGTEMHEKMWIRSYTNETYLWYDEVTDQDPEPFETVQDYFEILKTDEITASGRSKDEFHFISSYDDFFTSQQAGLQLGYGISWSFGEMAPPRGLTVKYVEPKSPAALAGIKRGDKLQSVNGVDFVNDNTQEGVNTINQVLTERENNTHSFVFSSPDGSEKAVNIAPAEFDKTSVEPAQIFDLGEKKVGYVLFNEFVTQAQDGLIDAFTQFEEQSVDELILDLRYNGGGRVDIAQQLAYMIAGNNALDRPFLVSTANDKRTDDNVSFGFESNKINFAQSTYEGKLPTLNKNKVYILTTNNSASASEAIINGLRGIDVEVILVGSDTRGKPYGFLPTINCDTVYYTVQFKAANAKGFGDYENGFIITPESQIVGEQGLDAKVPGCMVEDDLSNQFGIQEGMIAGALTHINTGSCPEVTAQKQSRKAFTNNIKPIVLPEPTPDKQVLILPKKAN